MTDDDTAVRALLQGTVTAWTANDADAFAGLYTEDATVLLANGTCLRDREEIRAYMKAGFASMLKGTSGFDEVETLRFVAPGAAVAVSRSGFTPGGPPRRAIWTLAAAEAGWRVAAYANGPAD
jgi:uncharacterized protein (TIGR02246 family)